MVQRTRYGRLAKLTCYVIAVAGSQAERITTQKSVVWSTSPNQTGIALIAIRQSVAAVRTLPHRIVLNLVIVGLFSDQTGRAHFIAKDITAIARWGLPIVRLMRSTHKARRIVTLPPTYPHS